jgi:thioredoxin-like negative regulator of GroEL
VRLTPLFKKLSNEYTEKMVFVMVNAVENQDLASGYGIMGVPTLKFLCAGKPVAELVGFKSEKELRQAFDEALIKFPECVEKRSPLYI